MEHVGNTWFVASAWMRLAFVASVLSIRTVTQQHWSQAEARKTFR